MMTIYPQIRSHFFTGVIPFWDRLKDEEYGGFYGRVTYALQFCKNAPKGGIATARTLWFYSAAYRILKQERFLENAAHVFRFLRDHFIDPELGGVFWMTDHKGVCMDERKHVYNQAFAIYGLSEYHRATGDATALDIAKELFALVENKGHNEQYKAYGEEYTRDWIPKDNIELSENGVLAHITMNTHLHLLEAYTNLYKAWPNPRLKDRLISLIADFQSRIYNPEKRRFDVFFNEEWQPILDMRSFGHDIEATWLIHDAVRTVGYDNPDIIQIIRDVGNTIADIGLNERGYLWNEWVEGELDKTLVWWPQAEAMVGFYNLFQMTSDARFLDIIRKLWACSQAYLIDHRHGGEWYRNINPEGVPNREDIVDPWKVVYHNGRFYLMFIESMERG